MLNKLKYEINKLHHFSFSINCAYAIFDSQLLAWIPRSENIYDDALEFLSNEPIEFNNFGTKKILKIFCNNQVAHSIADDGLVYSWGHDRDKTGILGLGYTYNQVTPLCNTNFSNKKITQISISEKHGVAIDINHQVYTWGTGLFGELGKEGHSFANVPNPLQLGKYSFAIKAQCGPTFTCFIDYNGNAVYCGKVFDSDDVMKNSNGECWNNINSDQNRTCMDMSYVTNVKIIPSLDRICITDIFCGSSIIALLDSTGNLYVYNDDEGLYKVKLKLDHKIKSVKFININFYAVTLGMDFMYEFISRGRTFSLKDYYENVYAINPEFASKVNLLEMPYYTNLLFFMIECSATEKESVEHGHRKFFTRIKYQKENTNLPTDFFSDNENNQSRIKELIVNINTTDDHINKTSSQSETSVLPPNKSIRKNLNDESRTTSTPNVTVLKPGYEESRIGRISNLLGHIFDTKINQINSQLQVDKYQKARHYYSAKKRIELERVGIIDRIFPEDPFKITGDITCSRKITILNQSNIEPGHKRTSSFHSYLSTQKDYFANCDNSRKQAGSRNKSGGALYEDRERGNYGDEILRIRPCKSFTRMNNNRASEKIKIDHGPLTLMDDREIKKKLDYSPKKEDDHLSEGCSPTFAKEAQLLENLRIKHKDEDTYTNTSRLFKVSLRPPHGIHEQKKDIFDSNKLLFCPKEKMLEIHNNPETNSSANSIISHDLISNSDIYKTHTVENQINLSIMSNDNINGSRLLPLSHRTQDDINAFNSTRKGESRVDNMCMVSNGKPSEADITERNDQSERPQLAKDNECKKEDEAISIAVKPQIIYKKSKIADKHNSNFGNKTNHLPKNMSSISCSLINNNKKSGISDGNSVCTTNPYVLNTDSIHLDLDHEEASNGVNHKELSAKEEKEVYSSNKQEIEIAKVFTDKHKSTIPDISKNQYLRNSKDVNRQFKGAYAFNISAAKESYLQRPNITNEERPVAITVSKEEIEKKKEMQSMCPQVKQNSDKRHYHINLRNLNKKTEKADPETEALDEIPKCINKDNGSQTNQRSGQLPYSEHEKSNARDNFQTSIENTQTIQGTYIRTNNSFRNATEQGSIKIKTLPKTINYEYNNENKDQSSPIFKQTSLTSRQENAEIGNENAENMIKCINDKLIPNDESSDDDSNQDQSEQLTENQNMKEQTNHLEETKENGNHSNIDDDSHDDSQKLKFGEKQTDEPIDNNFAQAMQEEKEFIQEEPAVEEHNTNQNQDSSGKALANGEITLPVRYNAQNEFKFEDNSRQQDVPARESITDKVFESSNNKIIEQTMNENNRNIKEEIISQKKNDGKSSVDHQQKVQSNGKRLNNNAEEHSKKKNTLSSREFLFILPMSSQAGESESLKTNIISEKQEESQKDQKESMEDTSTNKNIQEEIRESPSLNNKESTYSFTKKEEKMISHTENITKQIDQTCQNNRDIAKENPIQQITDKKELETHTSQTSRMINLEKEEKKVLEDNQQEQISAFVNEKQKEMTDSTSPNGSSQKVISLHATETNELEMKKTHTTFISVSARNLKKPMVIDSDAKVRKAPNKNLPSNDEKEKDSNILLATDIKSYSDNHILSTTKIKMEIGTNTESCLNIKDSEVTKVQSLHFEGNDSDEIKRISKEKVISGIKRSNDSDSLERVKLQKKASQLNSTNEDKSTGGSKDSLNFVLKSNISQMIPQKSPSSDFESKMNNNTTPTTTNPPDPNNGDVQKEEKEEGSLYFFVTEVDGLTEIQEVEEPTESIPTSTRKKLSVRNKTHVPQEDINVESLPVVRISKQGFIKMAKNPDGLLEGSESLQSKEKKETLLSGPESKFALRKITEEQEDCGIIQQGSNKNREASDFDYKSNNNHNNNNSSSVNPKTNPELNHTSSVKSAEMPLLTLPSETDHQASFENEDNALSPTTLKKKFIPLEDPLYIKQKSSLPPSFMKTDDDTKEKRKLVQVSHLNSFETHIKNDNCVNKESNKECHTNQHQELNEMDNNISHTPRKTSPNKFSRKDEKKMKSSFNGFISKAKGLNKVNQSSQNLLSKKDIDRKSESLCTPNKAQHLLSISHTEKVNRESKSILGKEVRGKSGKKKQGEGHSMIVAKNSQGKLLSVKVKEASENQSLIKTASKSSFKSQPPKVGEKDMPHNFIKAIKVEGTRLDVKGEGVMKMSISSRISSNNVLSPGTKNPSAKKTRMSIIDKVKHRNHLPNDNEPNTNAYHTEGNYVLTVPACKTGTMNNNNNNNTETQTRVNTEKKKINMSMNQNDNGKNYYTTSSIWSKLPLLSEFEKRNIHVNTPNKIKNTQIKVVQDPKNPISHEKGGRIPSNPIQDSELGEIKKELLTSIKELKEKYIDYLKMTYGNEEAVKKLNEFTANKKANEFEEEIIKDLLVADIPRKETNTEENFSLVSDPEISAIIKQDDHNPEEMRNFILHNLENFKLRSVKEKLEHLINRIGYAHEQSPNNVCNPITIEYDDENREKSSIYEPLELDKSVRSINLSRKSFTNTSQFGLDTATIGSNSSAKNIQSSCENLPLNSSFKVAEVDGILCKSTNLKPSKLITRPLSIIMLNEIEEKTHEEELSPLKRQRYEGESANCRK